MKLRSLLLAAIFFALLPSTFGQQAEPAKPIKPPSVNEILDKYVKALGGPAAIQAIKSRSVKGTLDLVPMNLKGTFESYAAPEAKAFSKLTIAGIGDLLEGTDGKTAWAINPIQGSRERTGAELLQAKLLNDFYRDINLAKLFPKMELTGTANVGVRNAYVVIASAEGLSPETWYFDTETGLMLRSDFTAIAPEGNQPMTVYYEDLRLVDGVKVPFRIRTKTPSFEIILTSTEVKHNLPIDDSKFSRPKI
ncbi:MAG: hypothetical protein IT174_00490 [Acidobacteria bacterium]|nr:hypothetical protein [Acidobacteriota bacterium]